jgi:hypothetical protein
MPRRVESGVTYFLYFIKPLNFGGFTVQSTVTTTFTTLPNIKTLFIHPTEYIYVFHIILEINCDFLKFEFIGWSL